MSDKYPQMSLAVAQPPSADSDCSSEASSPCWWPCSSVRLHGTQDEKVAPFYSQKLRFRLPFFIADGSEHVSFLLRVIANSVSRLNPSDAFKLLAFLASIVQSRYVVFIVLKAPQTLSIDFRIHGYESSWLSLIISWDLITSVRVFCFKISHHVFHYRGAVAACALPWLRRLLLQHASGIMSRESSFVCWKFS